MTIHVLPVRVKNPYDCPEVSTVSSSGEYEELSPFILTIPCSLSDIRGQLFGSIIFENLWQFSKVYKMQVGSDGKPTPEWLDWRITGFASKYAHRYPMGRDAIPEYSWWDNERLGYIEARKKIYAPEYAKNVKKTMAFARLIELYDGYSEITLKDYDAYDHIAMSMSLVDVINNPDRKMGHAFVLAMMLEGVLEECLTLQ